MMNISVITTTTCRGLCELYAKTQGIDTVSFNFINCNNRKSSGFCSCGITCNELPDTFFFTCYDWKRHTMSCTITNDYMSDNPIEVYNDTTEM